LNISRYHQQFDLEGETGIVVRGIGTSVTLSSESDNAVFTQQPLCAQSPDQHMYEPFLIRHFEKTLKRETNYFICCKKNI